MDRNRTIALVLLVFVLATIAWLAVTGPQANREADRIGAEGPRTTATVTDRFEARQKGDTSQITVTFDAGGAPQQAVIRAPRPDEVPETVEIAYDPDDPSQAVLVGSSAELGVAAGRTDLAMIALLVIVAAALGAYVAFPGFRGFVHQR